MFREAYAYVGGNPISRFDPFGLAACDCSKAAQAQAKAPDGDKWDEGRVNNGQREAYRFGRWNPTYSTPENFISDYVTNAAVSAGAGAGATYLASRAVSFSGWGFVVGTTVGAGHAGMQDFQRFQSSVYSPAEQRIINEYNQALTDCLRSGAGGIE